MHRSLLPFILASLGFFIFLVVVDKPLFEWQISEIVTDLPSDYDSHIFPSPWTTYIGDALDDGSYILREGVNVSGNGDMCGKENLKFVVTRSRKDELVERVLTANLKKNSLLFIWGRTGLVLTGIYLWWFVIEYKHGSASQAFIFTGIAGLVCIFLILSARVVGPRLPYPEIAADCYGIISFNARLLKVHYETLLLFWTGILLELATLGVMVRQIVKAVSK